jgi:DNA-binding response OmpR family regulator
MDGIQLVNYIRTSRESPNAFLGIIMLTGYTDMQQVMNARDSGINEIVAKPFAPETLRERIISVIEQPRNFVMSKRYIGPDRRRRDEAELAPAERRGAAKARA